MHSALLGLAAASLAWGAAINNTLVRRDGQCNIAQAPAQIYIGGPEGGDFCESHWPSGDLIVGLRSWSNDNVMTALEVTYSSGKKIKHGGTGSGPQEASGSIMLKPGERVVAAYLKGNGNAKRLGLIHLETDKGQNVDLGKVRDGVDQHALDPGTGFLVGIGGKKGTEIDGLSLHFLAGTLEKIEINNFKFIDDPSKNFPDMKVKSYDKVHFWNGMQTNMQCDFTSNIGETSVHTYSQATRKTFGTEIKVEAKVGFPEVADFSVSVSAKIEVSEESTTSGSYSKAVNRGYADHPVLLPNTGADCFAYAADGTGDFQYTSDVILHLGDGATFKYTELGMLRSVVYSIAQRKCVATSVDASPDGYKHGDVVQIHAVDGNGAPGTLLTPPGVPAKTQTTATTTKTQTTTTKTQPTTTKTQPTTTQKTQPTTTTKPKVVVLPLPVPLTLTLPA